MKRLLEKYWILLFMQPRYFVPRTGIEPARPNGHMALNHACLPVPAPGHLISRQIYIKNYSTRPGYPLYFYDENSQLKGKKFWYGYQVGQ